MEYRILGILVKEPGKVGENLQNLFSNYGCIIRTRIGLNRDNIQGGVIILDLHGDEHQIELFLNELNDLEGIQYKYINL